MTYAGAESKLGMAWENATPSDAKHSTPAATNTTSSSQSRGQPVPKSSRPATVMIVIWTAVLVTALPAIPRGTTWPASGSPDPLQHALLA